MVEVNDYFEVPTKQIVIQDMSDIKVVVLPLVCPDGNHCKCITVNSLGDVSSEFAEYCPQVVLLFDNMVCCNKMKKVIATPNGQVIDQRFYDCFVGSN